MDTNGGFKTHTDIFFLLSFFTYDEEQFNARMVMAQMMAGNMILLMMNPNHLDKYHIIKLVWRHIEEKYVAL